MQEQKALSTRDKLRQAATTLFYEKGYPSVSLNMIAAEAGLKQGNIYYHFRTKRDLGITVLERWLEITHDGLDNLSDKRSARYQILGYLDWSEEQETAYLNFGCPIARLTDELLRDSGEEDQAAVPLIYPHILDWLYARLIEYGFNSFDATVGAKFILSTTQGAIHIGHVLQDRSVFEAMRQQIDTWLQQQISSLRQ